MQSRAPLRIIKLGGSLLSLVDLRQRFHAWLETQSPACNLIVVGGGQAVEAIRELDAVHHFPTKLTHWMCVDLMCETAKLASHILGTEGPISTANQLDEFRSQHDATPAVACVLPTAYYTPSLAVERKCSLPECWDCTSDSIAAWLASSLAADQLVLLKSIESEFSPTSSLSSNAIRILADAGAVDPIFPDACQFLSDVRIVNLRAVA